MGLEVRGLVYAKKKNNNKARPVCGISPVLAQGSSCIAATARGKFRKRENARLSPLRKQIKQYVSINSEVDGVILKNKYD